MQNRDLSQDKVSERERAVAFVTKGCTRARATACDAVAVANIFDLWAVDLSARADFLKTVR